MENVNFGGSTNPIMTLEEENAIFQKMANYEKTLSCVSNQDEDLDSHLAKIQKAWEETTAALSKLQSNHNSLVHFTGVLESYCLELDTNSRRKHLILTGIQEVRNEGDNVTEAEETSMEESTFDPCKQLVFETLSTIMDTLIIDDIDVAYRVGRRGTQPRPILVIFARESIRNEINRKRFQPKEVDATKSAFLNADLPAKLSQQRLVLRSIVNLAKSKQIDTSFQGVKILVDKQVYRHNDLHKLPPGFRLSDAFQVNTPKGIAFSGQNVPFSNFFPVKIVYGGTEFKSAEHAYQHGRAVFAGDTKSA